VRDDGEVQRVSVAHVEPDKEAVLREPSCPVTTTETVKSGRPLLEDRSMSVPLIVRGRTIGAIGLRLEREDRTYNLFDLALAEDLADRAVSALDNASLYSKELEANRLKDEFLAMVSHELRTPLMPILGAIYKLRADGPNDEEFQRNLDVIERNAKGQARIVEDLLDISRMTTGKLEFNRQPIDLIEVVQTAVEVVRPAATALGIDLKTSLELPRQTVWCDRDRIQQVIWNLLSNAIKFTSRGGSVALRVENRDKGVRIRIEDTGAGITREFLPHVFEKFRQGDEFTTRMHGGLGLGLSIVRYVVERHGGTVRAESEGPGRGATFIVDLPFSY
jgi:signal transduction histidine kinase